MPVSIDRLSIQPRWECTGCLSFATPISVHSSDNRRRHVLSVADTTFDSHNCKNTTTHTASAMIDPFFPIERSIRSDLTSEDIDEIVAVWGGTTRMPQIRSLVATCRRRSLLMPHIDPAGAQQSR
jgi:hypothetical protein